MSNTQQFVKDWFLYLPQLTGKTTFGKAQEEVLKTNGLIRFRQIKDKQYTNNVLIRTKSGKEELKTKAQLTRWLQDIKVLPA